VILTRLIGAIAPPLIPEQKSRLSVWHNGLTGNSTDDGILPVRHSGGDDCVMTLNIGLVSPPQAANGRLPPAVLGHRPTAVGRLEPVASAAAARRCWPIPLSGRHLATLGWACPGEIVVASLAASLTI
jgi:hypothetical protein